MENFGMPMVAGITVICWLLGQFVKCTSLDTRWIPCLAGAAGAVLGLAGFMCMPGFPASDWLTALAVGIVSGLAATGANEAARTLEGRP